MTADIVLVRSEHKDGTNEPLPWGEWPAELAIPRQGDMVSTLGVVPCMRWVRDVVWFPYGVDGDGEPRVRIYLQDTP